MEIDENEKQEVERLVGEFNDSAAEYGDERAEFEGPCHMMGFPFMIGIEGSRDFLTIGFNTAAKAKEFLDGRLDSLRRGEGGALTPSS